MGKIAEKKKSNLKLPNKGHYYCYSKISMEIVKLFHKVRKDIKQSFWCLKWDNESSLAWAAVSYVCVFPQKVSRLGIGAIGGKGRENFFFEIKSACYSCFSDVYPASPKVAGKSPIDGWLWEDLDSKYPRSFIASFNLIKLYNCRYNTCNAVKKGVT